MGTRGNFALRYKGRYYVIYNHCDSYFSGLGYELIDAIKELTKEQWDTIKAKLTLYEPVYEEEDIKESDSKNKNIILNVMENYNTSDLQGEEPELDLFIEYVYIVDLDVDVFTAITRHHKDADAEHGEMRYNCRFENLSKEWLNSCESW